MEIWFYSYNFEYIYCIMWILRIYKRTYTYIGLISVHLYLMTIYLDLHVYIYNFIFSINKYIVIRSFFKMHHTFSIGDRSVLQAGQSSTRTRTLFLRSQDFVMCAECGFALSRWNMHGRPWKRCLLEGSILCSKISMYFSALMVPSQKCKLPLPRALTQPHTMTDPGFWTCCW